MSETPGVRSGSALRASVRVIKLCLALACYVYDVTRAAIFRLLRRNRAGTCVVLYYHSVPNEYRERFKAQMRLAVRLATPVDLRALPAFPPNTRFVGVTFDDALESFFDNAVPVLVRLNIPATVFAVVNALGDGPTWGESYYLPNERVMSAQQLQSMADLVTVGSHTLSHADLVAADPEAARLEISASRQQLEHILHRRVTLFSFPFGIFSASTVRYCQDAGYDRAFTTEPVLAFTKRDEFVVGRVAADPWDWDLEFHLKVLGAYRWDAALRVLVRTLRSLLPTEKPRANQTGIQPKLSADRILRRDDST